MKCPVCVESGQKSTVRSGGASITSMYFAPYYNDHGQCHDHVRNIYYESFQCSNGHAWDQESYGSCWCGWSGGTPQITVRAPDPIPSERQP